MDDFDRRRFATKLLNGDIDNDWWGLPIKHPEFHQYLLGNRPFDDCAVELIVKLLREIADLEDEVANWEDGFYTDEDI